MRTHPRTYVRTAIETATKSNEAVVKILFRPPPRQTPDIKNSLDPLQHELELKQQRPPQPRRHHSEDPLQRVPNRKASYTTCITTLQTIYHDKAACCALHGNLLNSTCYPATRNMATAGGTRAYEVYKYTHDSR